MRDAPDLARLVRDGHEVARSLQRLRIRAGGVAAAGRLERPHLWSGKPRMAAGYRELAAGWRRSAVMAASVGLRHPHADGATWLEAAASCWRTAEACERIARMTAGRGWRRPWRRGALWGALWGSLLGLLLGAAVLLAAHLASGL